MRKENLTLKETKVKQDILQNDPKKLPLEDINEIKEKLSQCEKILKEKEDEINTLKNRDNQKVIDTGMYHVVRHPMYLITIIMRIF